MVKPLKHKQANRKWTHKIWKLHFFFKYNITKINTSGRIIFGRFAAFSSKKKSVKNILLVNGSTFSRAAQNQCEACVSPVRLVKVNNRMKFNIPRFTAS
jgi:hypothetical protein